MHHQTTSAGTEVEQVNPGKEPFILTVLNFAETYFVDCLSAKQSFSFGKR